jgi:amino acid transporter
MGSGLCTQLAAGRLLYGMGRGNALPNSFFGVLEPKHRIPRNNIILIGLLARTGAVVLEFFSRRLGGGAYEIGAQALNFGALISFMGVNAASAFYQWRHPESRNISGLAVPVFGFLVCAMLWLNLSRPALILGSAWMIVGITYGAIRTRGFRTALVSFDVPPDDL